MWLVLILIFFATTAADASSWIFVAKKVSANAVTKVTKITADPSLVPVAVKRWNGIPVTPVTNCPLAMRAAGCYLIQVNEDLSAYAPNAVSPWQKATPGQVTTILTAYGAPLQKPLPIAPNAIGGWLRGIFTPRFAYALSGSDNFARADADPLDGSWTNYCFNGCSATLQIVSGLVLANITSRPAYSLYNGYSSAANQSAEILVSVLNSSCEVYECSASPIVRADGTDNFYAAMVFANPAYSELDYYKSDGTITTLASDSVTQWVSGDYAKLGIIGNNLTLYRNGNVFLTWSDPTLATGQPGMMNIANLTARTQVGSFTSADLSGAARPHGVIFQ